MISLAHAQEAASAASSTTGAIQQIAFLVLMFGVMWFIMIRPQMKKAKEHKAMVESLAKGDEVVTQGGIAGRVTKVGDSGYITVEIAEGKDGPVEIVVQKPAVTLVLPKGTLKTL